MESLLHNGHFVFWSAITLICVVVSLAHYWWKVRKAELDAALKQEMIQKGMGAEDIERVLNTGKKRCGEE
jgi:hypothetical protein